MQLDSKKRNARTLPRVILITCFLALTGWSQTLERVWSVPRVATFWSMQLTNQPPLPFLPPYLPSDTPVYLLSTNAIYAFDDRSIDYEAYLLKSADIFNTSRLHQ